MIHYNGKEISAAYIGRRALSAIYAGSRLVWTAISSCFGSGFWRGEKPWSRQDGWRRTNRHSE